MKQTLSEKLLEFCHTYKGESKNPHKRAGEKVAWDWEKDAIWWIRQICISHSVHLNLDFFRKKKWDILSIETYVTCSVPNIPRDIRVKKGEYHVRDGEAFYNDLYSDDTTWEKARISKYKVDPGGITLHRNQ